MGKKGSFTLGNDVELNNVSVGYTTFQNQNNVDTVTINGIGNGKMNELKVSNGMFTTIY